MTYEQIGSGMTSSDFDDSADHTDKVICGYRHATSGLAERPIAAEFAAQKGDTQQGAAKLLLSHRPS